MVTIKGTFCTLCFAQSQWIRKISCHRLLLEIWLDANQFLPCLFFYQCFIGLHHAKLNLLLMLRFNYKAIIHNGCLTLLVLKSAKCVHVFTNLLEAIFQLQIFRLCRTQASEWIHQLNTCNTHSHNYLSVMTTSLWTNVIWPTRIPDVYQWVSRLCDTQFTTNLL